MRTGRSRAKPLTGITPDQQLDFGLPEETFKRLSALFSAIASAIDEAGGPTVPADVLWEHLKDRLLGLAYTLYIQNPPGDAGEAVQRLTAYVER